MPTNRPSTPFEPPGGGDFPRPVYADLHEILTDAGVSGGHGIEWLLDRIERSRKHEKNLPEIT